MRILGVQQINRSWYHVILWWEIRRIPYNLLMLLVGIASFFIAYATIPLIYLVVGVGLNIIYTLGWIIELAFRPFMSEQAKLEFPKMAIITYAAISTLFIFGVAISFYI